MTHLSTNIYYASVPPAPVPPAPPAPSITLPEPISYEFQVVEYMENEKVMKVALQFKKNIHDQYGNIKLHGVWIDVPRIKVPYVAPVV